MNVYINSVNTRRFRFKQVICNIATPHERMMRFFICVNKKWFASKFKYVLYWDNADDFIIININTIFRLQH